MPDNILEIKNLHRRYNELSGEVLALENVSFSVKDKEFIAIVGPSGCGKSTILSILADVQAKTSGEIILKKDVNIGYMLQEDALLEWKTVLENCLLGLELNNLLNNKTKEKTIKLLKTYGLEDFMNKYPNSLSGGMRQRVALIRTLVLDPDILLLDEPFSALDYQTRLALSDDIYNVIKNEGKTVIMATHDIAEAVSMADKVIVLTKRPCSVKNIYNINLSDRSTPINNRKSKEFPFYYDKIWRDLDVTIGWTN